MHLNCFGFINHLNIKSTDICCIPLKIKLFASTSSNSNFRKSVQAIKTKRKFGLPSSERQQQHRQPTNVGSKPAHQRNQHRRDIYYKGRHARIPEAGQRYDDR